MESRVLETFPYGTLREVDNLGAKVKVMDISSFSAITYQGGSRSEKEREAQTLISCMSAPLGFGAVTDANHIITPEHLSDAYDFIKLLFSLPEPVLRKFVTDNTSSGYSWLGREAYREDKPENWKRFWHVSPSTPSTFWPSMIELAGRSKGDRDFYSYCTTTVIPTIHKQFGELGVFVLNVLAHHYYGLEKDHFSEQPSRRTGNNWLRLLEYVPNPAAQGQEIIAGAHRDSSSLTVLDTSHDPSSIPCLEVLAKKIGWVAANVPKGGYVINIGLTLERYFAQLQKEEIADPKVEPLKRTVHRVVRRDPHIQRLSIVEFLGPQSDFCIGNETAGEILTKDLSRYNRKRPLK